MKYLVMSPFIPVHHNGKLTYLKTFEEAQAIADDYNKFLQPKNWKGEIPYFRVMKFWTKEDEDASRAVPKGA